MGGIQVIVNRLYRDLDKKYQQEVLTTRPIKAERPFVHDHIIVAPSILEIRSLPIAPTIISKLWKKLKSIDLACIHYPFPLADIAIAVYPFKLPKIIVYWHSEIVSQKYLKIILRPFTNRMLELADKVIISSPEMLKYSSLLEKHHDKTVVIPFGIDKPSKNNHSQSNSVELLAIGRHVPYKGFESLIRAISTTDYHLTIVGNGPLLVEHRKLVNSLDITDQVKFISNAGNHQLKQLLASCKALVMPSIMPSEAFGLVQIEAMSYGKPIINTNLKSGVPWVARHMKEALTVSPGNIGELRNAIQQLMSDQTLYSQLCQGALIRHKDRFSTQKFLASTEDCYSQILD